MCGPTANPGRCGAQLIGGLVAIVLLAAPLQVTLAQQEPAARDDFDLLPAEKPSDPAQQKELERKLALRRQMLQLHQLGGFVTLGAMGATVVLG